MAKSEHVVLRAAIYACVVVIFLQILIYGVGGVINLANPAIEPAETVLIWAATQLVPPVLGALLVVWDGPGRRGLVADWRASPKDRS